MINIAIAGFGNIGQVHAANLASMRGCRLTGIFDVREEALQKAPSGARRYRDIAELVSDESVDAVIVSTPSDSHRAIAEAALAAGKHVFVEKPLASTLEDAEAIAMAARRSGRVAQAGFCERFNPQYMEARRAVTTGAIGKIRSIRSSRTAPLALGDPSWKLGVLDTAVHNLDLILWLKGEMPLRVRSYGVRIDPDSPMPHAVTTVMEFADGALADDEIAWIRDSAHPLHECARSRMTVTGTAGVFEVDLASRPSSLLTADAFRQIDTVIIGGPEYYSCLRLQFEAFLCSIEQGVPVLAPLEDAVLAERLVMAAALSLETGQEVLL
jgi:predicted dehydrogenase